MEGNEVFQQADGSIRRPTKLNSDLRRPQAHLRSYTQYNPVQSHLNLQSSTLVQSYSAGAHYSEQFACTNTKVCNLHIADSVGLESSVLNNWARECEQVGWPLERVDA